jgi:hypothetical protein
VLSLESLGSRVVLSAGGLAAGVYEAYGPASTAPDYSKVNYSKVDYSTVDYRVAGTDGNLESFGPNSAGSRIEFSSVAALANTSLTAVAGPTFMGPGVTVLTVMTDAPSGSGFTSYEAGRAFVPNTSMQSRPMSGVPYEFNLAANLGLTFVVNATTSFPGTLSFALLNSFSPREFEPLLRDHSFGSSLDFRRPGAPYQTESPFEPIVDGPSVAPVGTSNADPRVAGIVHDLPARGASAEPHATGTWILPSTSTTVSLTATSENTTASKIALAPNRIETPRADAEGGLIELESSTLPRSKRNLKLDSSLDKEDSDSDELRKLLDTVWSGWDRAWDALGELRQAANELQSRQTSSEVAAAAAEDAAAQVAIANAEGGMIELSSPAAAPANDVAAGSGAAHLVQTHLDSGKKVRMDAGVALYQSFELATAPDAVPPARNARATNEKGDGATSASEKNAKSKTPSVETNTSSAAIIGAGLLVSVPFSVFRLHRHRDSEAVRPQLNARPFDPTEADG